MDFNIYRMDFKSAFLNVFIEEEIYVEQPPDFENFEFPNHVFKLSKVLYGLNQAPRDWYERSINFFLKQGFSKEKVNITLFIKKSNDDLLIVQIYIDDIIFGATNHCLCEDFSKLMQGDFEMRKKVELK